jgi:thiol-disulfide isomerase/thioredoxin
MSEPEPESVNPESAPRGARLWLLVLGLLVLAWFAFLFTYGPKQAATREGADFSLRLKDLDGKAVDFASYRGRPIFLNFWATWCGPCRNEMPSIARLAANPRVKDIVFLCASVEDNPDEIRSYARREKLDLPFVIAKTPLPKVFETEGIPATFVISRDGKIAIAEVGSMEWDEPATVNRIAALVK